LEQIWRRAVLWRSPEVPSISSRAALTGMSASLARRESTPKYQAAGLLIRLSIWLITVSALPLTRPDAKPPEHYRRPGSLGHRRSRSGSPTGEGGFCLTIFSRPPKAGTRPTASGCGSSKPLTWSPPMPAALVRWEQGEDGIRANAVTMTSVAGEKLGPRVT